MLAAKKEASMLIFEHTFPRILIILAVLSALGVGMYSTWKLQLENKGRLGLFGLYFALLACMLWVMLMPGCRILRTRTVKPRFIVMLDTSQSMLQSAPGTAETRWDRSLRGLRMPWVDHVKKEADIDFYAFDSQLYPRAELSAAQMLAPTGTSTRIRDGLQQLDRLTAGHEVAAVLLLTDGHDTREASVSWAVGGFRRPIYTVRLEDDIKREPEPDVAIQGVDTLRRVMQGRQTEMRVIVSGQETGGVPLVLQLFRDDVLADEQPVVIPNEGAEREVSFLVQHDVVGVFSYRLFVPPLTGEKNVANNEFLFTVTVLDSENRLLYLEGVPRFEYRFLRRVLLADEQIASAIFFSLSDGSVQAGNAIEGVKADLDADTLAKLKIVLLGNLSADELSETRAQRLVDFVEGGGSLVLLGGSRAWSADGFLATALRRVAPIESVDSAALENEGDKGFETSLTFAGRAHPVFSGDPEYWSLIPPVLGIFPNARSKPGAEVLAVAHTPRGDQTLVAVQRFGRGRVAAILTDSLWRWQLDPLATHHPYARFWTQLLSWLLPEDEEDDKDRIELFADSEQVYAGESVVLTARVPEAILREGQRPSLQIKGPDGRTIPYTMVAGQILLPDGRGLPGYTYTYSPTAPGSYEAVATYIGRDGELSSTPVMFHLRDYSPETILAAIKEDVLRALARSSSGRHFDDLDSLNRALLNFTADEAQERLTQHHSLWQRWIVVFLLMAIAGGTWFFRKRLQMP
jgi:uncharacterized membrane protein